MATVEIRNVGFVAVCSSWKKNCRCSWHVSAHPRHSQNALSAFYRCFAAHFAHNMALSSRRALQVFLCQHKSLQSPSWVSWLLKVTACVRSAMPARIRCFTAPSRWGRPPYREKDTLSSLWASSHEERVSFSLHGGTGVQKPSGLDFFIARDRGSMI